MALRFDCSAVVSSGSSAQLCEELNFTGLFWDSLQMLRFRWGSYISCMLLWLFMYINIYDIRFRFTPRPQSHQDKFQDQGKTRMLNNRIGCKPFKIWLFASLFPDGFLCSSKRLLEISMATLTGWKENPVVLLRNLSALQGWHYHSRSYCIWP